MKISFSRLVLIMFCAVCLSLASAGCQTTRGFGKDVEKLGDNIQDGAK
jgi:predicted small secreted protein